MSILLFDLDDTLMVEDAAATAAFEATARHAGLDTAALVASARTRARALWNAFAEHPYCLRIGISSSEAMWCRFEGAAPEIRRLRAWVPEYRLAAWTEALADQGVHDPALAQELADRFGRERRALHQVFEDAAPALDDLRRDHRLALLTNGASCLQREKLAASGLADRFEAVFVSGEIDAGKPDPAAFVHALERLGGDPADAWMIGDSLERDIEGALAAGLRAVWLNREGRAGGHHPQVRSLSELRALIG